MRTLFGITNIQVYECDDIDELNEFLLEYNGNVIDIQCTAGVYHVIYQYHQD